MAEMAEGHEKRSLSSAPPLTFENVLNAVKKVKNWRTLCRAMLILQPPDDIQRQHGSDEDCLKAVVKQFLQGKEVRYRNPSWRAVIWSLYKASEVHLAEQIRSYAEPKQGTCDPTMTVENVIGVMETVAADRREEVWSHLGVIPDTLPEEIYQKYSTEDQRLHACADIYVNYHPNPSWTYLCQKLFYMLEMTAAEKAKTFIPQTGHTLTVENLIGVMETVAVDRRKEVWSYCGAISDTLLEEIYQKYSTEDQKLHACADIYVNCRPNPSWTNLCRSLFKMNEVTAVRKAKTFIPQTDPTLTVENLIGVMETVAVDRRKDMWSICGAIPDTLLEEIYQKYSTEDQKLHACADIFVNCHPDPSWTDFCRGLLYTKEMTAARKAKTYIPQTDSTWTVENVIGVMEKVKDGCGVEVWSECLGDDLLKDINSRCSTETELMHTCSDIYVNCKPDSSWEALAHGLYLKEETAAVEEVRSYLNPRDLTLTTERLVELFASLDDEDRTFYFSTPLSKKKEFQTNYKDLDRRQEAYLDYYVHNNPLASWTEVAGVLYLWGLSEQAAVVENTYIKVSERTRLNFDTAMSEGTLWIRNGNTFFLGPGGSGKTHTLSALLDEDPPPTRESTACAKTPVRAIAQLKMGVSGTTHFMRITEDDYSEMIANSAEDLSMPPPQKKMKLSQTLSSSEPSGQPSSSTADQTQPQKSSEPLSPATSTEGSIVHRQTHVPKPGLKKELLCRMQAKSIVSDRLNNKDLVNNRDSGGQPMFHEVLPVFVTNTSCGILTVKLNECLDEHPMVEYFIAGDRIGKPFKSPFTHLQTFRHCVKFLQSSSEECANPMLVFVGTHKDLEHECKDEDRKAKNQKLLSIVPPEMEDKIIFNGKELLFAINAKRPGDADRKVMADIRKLIIHQLQKLPRVKIPLRYFSLEMLFQRLAKHKRKAVLSVEECFKEASAYCFTRESFKDALRYLHSLKLILYYEDILPDVVFIDAQVLLDKITEIVEYSIELESEADNQEPTVGNLKLFKMCGIITSEILSRFTSGYVPDLFTEKELKKVFLKLFIIAEIGNGKYLMACLLREEKVLASCDRSARQVVPDLFYYFGSDGAKLGVYCFLVSSLINEAKWELLMEGGSPVQLSRNRARFTVPGDNPGCVTITDSFSTFFRVRIEFPDKVTAERATEICKKVCPTIRETILTNIRVAYHKLNYKDSVPKAAFLCSEHEGTSPHPAVISDTGILTCTTDPGSVCSQMTDEHKVWLGKSTASATAVASELTTRDLRKVLSASWGARTKWLYIGLELEIDPDTLNVIEGNNNKNIDDCFRAMLTTWLKMDEPKPTLQALAAALQSPTVGYSHLAEQL